jgi:hypothetical protein
MAKFEASQVADVLAINQLVNEWATELDINNGVTMADLLTGDCAYTVRGVPRHGPAEVVTFYEGRKAELAATEAGVPVHRHALSNLRVTFTGTDSAKMEFGLIYFTEVVLGMGADVADPFSFADVSMDARRCADGHWRIARFDSAPVFVRSARV